MGRFKSLALPVTIPRSEVKIHWHERLAQDPGNRWMRELFVTLHSER
jgi:hypothetical protein